VAAAWWRGGGGGGAAAKAVVERRCLVAIDTGRKGEKERCLKRRGVFEAPIGAMPAH